MPIYEYRCTQCGHKLEALQKFSDAPLTTCPACGKETLAKQLSAAGFQLKGSGWYQTDFRGGAAKPAEKSDGAKAESGDGAKGESKGSAKSEAGSDGSASASSSGTASAPAATPAPSSTPSTGGSAS